MVPRVSDLEALMSSTAGKIEIESMEEGRDGKIVETMLRAAVLEVFKNRFSPDELSDVVASFGEGKVVHTGDDLGSDAYMELLEGNRVRWRWPPSRWWQPPATTARPARAPPPAVLASAVELVLEGLHLSKRLNKEHVGARATYRSRG